MTSKPGWLEAAVWIKLACEHIDTAGLLPGESGCCPFCVLLSPGITAFPSRLPSVTRVVKEGSLHSHHPHRGREERWGPHKNVGKRKEREGFFQQEKQFPGAGEGGRQEVHESREQSANKTPSRGHGPVALQRDPEAASQMFLRPHPGVGTAKATLRFLEAKKHPVMSLWQPVMNRCPEIRETLLSTLNQNRGYNKNQEKADNKEKSFQHTETHNYWVCNRRKRL